MKHTYRIALNTSIGLFFVLMILVIIVFMGTIVDFLYAGILTNSQAFRNDGVGFMAMVTVVMGFCYVVGACIRSLIVRRS